MSELKPSRFGSLKEKQEPHHRFGYRENLTAGDVIAVRQESRREHAKGYVYLMTDASGLYKIGHTNNIRNRLNIFLMGNPTITLIHSFYTQERSRTETLLHEIYATKRIVGEWFALSREDVECIATMTGSQQEYEKLQAEWLHDILK